MSYFRLMSVTFNTFECRSVCKREGRLGSVCAEKERSVCDDPNFFQLNFCQFWKNPNLPVMFKYNSEQNLLPTYGLFTKMSTNFGRTLTSCRGLSVCDNKCALKYNKILSQHMILIMNVQQMSQTYRMTC